jgi:cell wall-associated NlpC family hydrolase
VQNLLTPDQFATRAVGLPWIRWRSDWQAVDCFGLVVLYYRAVLGVDLGDVPQTDIASGFIAAQSWKECESDAGATCFMAWREGAPTHCGIVLTGSMLMHAEGSQEHPCSVRVTRLSAVERVYGALKFYRYASC